MKPPRWWALAVLLAAGAGRAQVPAADEMAAAFRAAEAQARLALQPGALWWAAWRERSPLVAGYSRGVCQLGFGPYIPGRDYRWLFPALPAAQRAAWLAGLVQHELAHCAEQAAAQSNVEPADLCFVGSYGFKHGHCTINGLLSDLRRGDQISGQDCGDGVHLQAIRLAKIKCKCGSLQI